MPIMHFKVKYIQFKVSYFIQLFRLPNNLLAYLPNGLLACLP